MIRVCNVDIDAFFSRVRNKTLICFGAGKELVDFLGENKELLNNEIYVVDNYRYGKIINLYGKQVKLIPFADAVNRDEESIFLITTIKSAADFIYQMEENELFDNKMVYVSYMIRKYRRRIDTSFQLNRTGQKIPKTIHYCWFGHNKMPEQFCRNIKSWKTNNPEYEIVLWNETNYDVTKNLYMKQAYENKKWGFVPDYARIDIINTYGGIYLDTDVEVLKPFDELIGYDFFCGFEDEEYINFGLGFGATKNNTILMKMIEQYESLSFVNEDGGLNLIASPVYQTKALQNMGVIIDGRSREFLDGVVLSHEYFAPLDSFGIGELSENTFSIHQYAASWFDDEMMNEKKEILENMKVVQKRIWDDGLCAK